MSAGDAKPNMSLQFGLLVAIAAELHERFLPASDILIRLAEHADDSEYSCCIFIELPSGFQIEIMLREDQLILSYENWCEPEYAVRVIPLADPDSLEVLFQLALDTTEQLVRNAYEVLQQCLQQLSQIRTQSHVHDNTQ